MAPPTNGKPSYAVSALYCMWPVLWLVHTRAVFCMMGPALQEYCILVNGFKRRRSYNNYPIAVLLLQFLAICGIKCKNILKWLLYNHYLSKISPVTAFHFPFCFSQKGCSPQTYCTRSFASDMQAARTPPWQRRAIMCPWCAFSSGVRKAVNASKSKRYRFLKLS